MKKKVVSRSVMSKYDYTPDYMRPNIDYSEVVTVPDQVLSMQQIYEKFAVRGDIAGLANNVLPHVRDDFDLNDPSVDFVPEEDVDVLQRARMVRMASEAKAEEESDTIKTPEVQEAEPPAVGDKPAALPDSDPASDEQ